MEIFSGLTDDQTAVVGCAAALALCGGLLALSSMLGRRRTEQVPAEVSTLRFSAQAARSRRPAAVAEAESDRRAA